MCLGCFYWGGKKGQKGDKKHPFQRKRSFPRFGLKCSPSKVVELLIETGKSIFFLMEWMLVRKDGLGWVTTMWFWTNGRPEHLNT